MARGSPERHPRLDLDRNIWMFALGARSRRKHRDGFAAAPPSRGDFSWTLSGAFPGRFLGPSCLPPSPRLQESSRLPTWTLGS